MSYVPVPVGRLRSVALLLAALVAVLVVSCSGDDEPESPVPETSPTSIGAMVGATAEPTTERRQLITPPAGTVTPTAEFRGFPTYRMTITDFFGAREEVKDEAEIDAVVPWPIVLPSYLPPGYDQIGGVLVDLPMQNLPADAQARTTRVSLSFTSGPQAPAFMLILSGGHVGTDGDEEVLVNGQPAEFGVNAQGSQNLAWDVCGRTLVLTALERDLSRDELIRIAESVPEQCE